MLGRLEHCSRFACSRRCLPSSSDKDTKQPWQGRPVDTGKATAFLKVVMFLEENDEEQITITDLVNKMQEYLQGSEEQVYSTVYMKAKLKKHFGNKIVVTNLHKKANVVTFHHSVINYQ